MPPSPTDAIFRQLLRRLLAGGLYGLLLVGLLVLVAVPRVYQSSASLVFPLPERTGNPLAEDLFNAPIPRGSELPLDTYKAIIRSDRALTSVIKELDLVKVFHSRDLEEALKTLSANVKVVLSLDRTIVISTRAVGSARVWRPGDLLSSKSANARDEAARERAAQIGRLLIKQMDVIARDMKLDRAKSRYDDIKVQLVAEHTAMDNAMAALMQLQTSLGRPDLGDYGRVLGAKYAELVKDAIACDVKIASTKRSYDEGLAQVRGSLRRLDNVPTDVPMLVEARRAYQAALDNYTLQTQRLGPDSADVRRAKQVLDQAQQRLAAQAKEANKGTLPELMRLEIDLKAFTTEREALRGFLKRYEAEMRELPNRAWRVAQLTQDIDIRRARITQLERDQLQAQNDYERHGLYWRVLDEPVAPMRKSSPRTLILALAGGVFGAICAGGRSLLRVLLAWFNDDDSE